MMLDCFHSLKLCIHSWHHHRLEKGKTFCKTQIHTLLLGQGGQDWLCAETKRDHGRCGLWRAGQDQILASALPSTAYQDGLEETVTPWEWFSSQTLMQGSWYHPNTG